jgi:hypothetical protein
MTWASRSTDPVDISPLKKLLLCNLLTFQKRASNGLLVLIVPNRLDSIDSCLIPNVLLKPLMVVLLDIVLVHEELGILGYLADPVQSRSIHVQFDLSLRVIEALAANSPLVACTTEVLVRARVVDIRISCLEGRVHSALAIA